MSDLQAAASETAAKLTALLGQADEAQASLQTSQEMVASVREQVEAAWTGLNEQAQALLDQTTNAKTELATETESVGQVVVQLKDRVAGLEAELAQQLESTKTALTALDDGIEAQAPELEGSVQEAEAALTALQEKDIGSETEAAIAQTTDYLPEVNSELESHQTALDQRAEALEAYIFEQCLPAITTRVADFATQLEGVVETLVDKMQAVGDATEQSAQDTLDQVTENQTNITEGLLDTGAKVEEVMNILSSVADTAVSSVLDANAALVEGANQANTDAETSVGLLSEAKVSLEKVANGV